MFFHYFSYFRKETGNKIYLFIFFSIFAAGLDGLGISALVPLISLDFTGEMGGDVVSKLVYWFFSFTGIEPSVKAVLVFILVIFFVKLLFSFSQQVISSYITTWLSEHLKRKSAIAYSNMTYSYYTTTKIGFLNNLLTTEIVTVVACFKKLSQVVVLACNLLAYLAFSFMVNWQLTVAVLLLGLVLNITYKKIRISVAKISYRITKVNASTQNILIEFISNYKYLKATSTSNIYLKHLFPVLNNSRMLNFRNNVYDSFTLTTFDFFRVVVLVAALAFMVEVKGAKITELIVPLALIARSFGMILGLQSVWQAFVSKSGSIVVLEEAERKLKLNSEISKNDEIQTFNHAIQMTNVSYSFDTNSVLNDVNLTIKKGMCIGLAGPSGSGKTTMVDILVGLLEPTKGKVEIDGKDYSTLNKESLRSHFGYVTQDPVIFNDSIANNISFWDTVQSTGSKLENALESAGCTEFVSEFPEKEQAMVGDKGVKLSGGQRQRISIAREIYSDSDIIVFDEATAALDSESERIIQDSIEKLRGNKTMLIIAHRLSTLKICDMIHVINNGSIVEEGTWDELLHSENVFAEMCRKQGIIS
ncbi:ABC-type multidrug transport system, ATPase and permease component [Desulfocapsa sulfexigens DSM 10523]|uniref:ABC-type multidrug transport system, ATPase and permease component n=1 Tax=Desulfocapsa sulfexigens (strain DSM 10523 / SB164P1) TaxID=1167006 RepID=M1PHA8_DESSD|nr:ABC transporter ATP-binding protein [Desulfocapsa sulfexigens]AGF78985.1 ABC-type multidrug transport system, ATPase and permease component [Desulfocapsa sulfexigens DSM 10523]